MLEAVVPWPSVAGRVWRAWPWARPGTTWTFVGGGVRRELVIDDSPLPAPHPNLLWIAVPDVVRCACGARHPCVGRARGPRCESVADADARLELFRAWHMWLCHLPLAFVLQDGAERPGRVPWDAPGLAAVSSAAARPGSSGSPPPASSASRAAADCWRAPGGVQRAADPLRAVDRLHVV